MQIELNESKTKNLVQIYKCYIFKSLLEKKLKFYNNFSRIIVNFSKNSGKGILIPRVYNNNEHYIYS